MLCRVRIFQHNHLHAQTLQQTQSEINMTAKKTSKDNLVITREKGKSDDKKLAEISICATTLNAITARSFSKYIAGETSLSETVKTMREKVNVVNSGDIKDLEATLTAQASSLNAVYSELARRAISSDTMSKLEIYMRLSLKAQAQCARTIEVIATMKNPPIVFAKQANISNGHQQVNNGNLVTSTHAPAHAGKEINQSNELLEQRENGEWLDKGKATTTSNPNKTMAAVETLDRC